MSSLRDGPNDGVSMRDITAVIVRHVKNDEGRLGRVPVKNGQGWSYSIFYTNYTAH
jgi:hypothetical protein